MQYQEIIPIKALQGYVRYFWVLEDLNSGEGNKQFKILPDGIPALIYQDTPHLFRDIQQQTTPRLYVYGPFTKYTDQLVEGAFRVIGAYFEPTALKAIFKVDAFELNNQNIALDDLVSTRILEQLDYANTIADKIAILSAFLLKQIQEVQYENQKAKFASSLLQRGKTLQEIQMEMKISERTLERLIKHHVGMSPKIFSRIMRFQSSLNLLKSTDFDGFTTLAYTHDYFDQSHYIREFKEFTGTNPMHFLRQSKEQLPNFPEWKKEEGN